jgi:hypothetical protein
MNVSLQNKRCNILGSKKQHYQMMVLKQPRFEYKGKFKPKKQQQLLLWQHRSIMGIVIKARKLWEMTASGRKRGIAFLSLDHHNIGFDAYGQVIMCFYLTV